MAGKIHADQSVSFCSKQWCKSIKGPTVVQPTMENNPRVSGFVTPLKTYNIENINYLALLSL
jgi:hypothetical protein